MCTHREVFSAKFCQAVVVPNSRVGESAYQVHTPSAEYIIGTVVQKHQGEARDSTTAVWEGSEEGRTGQQSVAEQARTRLCWQPLAAPRGLAGLTPGRPEGPEGGR